MLWTLWGLGSDNGGLKPLNEILKSQVRRLALVKIQEEKESMDLELVRGRVNNLLLELEIDLGLNLIVKTSLTVDLLYLKDS